MDWTQVLTVFAVIATNLGTVIALYMHIDNKTTNLFNSIQSSTTAQLSAIQTEMKDFHTRLALQDQEFKMRLCNIEEKNLEMRRKNES